MPLRALTQPVLDAMPGTILVLDERGVIEQANSRVEATFGYRVDELIGQPIERFVPELRPQGQVLARALELDLRHRDGHVVSVEATLSPIEAEDGRHVIASVRDISHERAAKKALRDSSRLLEACFKYMLTQVAILDPEFNFVRVNEAYARATGYRVSDFPGKNHFELFPSDAKAIFEGVIARREPFQTFARPFVHPTHPEWGVTYWDWTLVPILADEGDEVELLVFALEDVTERVRTAEALRLKQRELNEAKQFELVGQLAAGVAHDFNNVLTSVLFTLELLKPNEDPMLEGLLSDSLELVQRAKGLTYQLLSFGRKQLLRPEIIELNAAVQARRSTISHLLSGAIELRVVTGDRGNALVKVDPTQLDRVLLNLVTNAVDAMPTGGRLTIVTTQIDIDATSASEYPRLASGSYVMLSVQDEGVGMDESTLARIFEPRFTTKAGEHGVGARGGSGLGLSSVLGIVKQSGGEIYVHSELGQGTTVKILFPRVDDAIPADEAPTATTPAEPGSSRGRTASSSILVVDDEAIIRQLVVEGLRRFGYVVHEAASGADAWAFLSQHADDVTLVLTDVMMAELDGATLATRIDEQYPSVQVALMSGRVDTATAEQSPDRPFIAKPFSPAEIRAYVEGLLAQA